MGKNLLLLSRRSLLSAIPAVAALSSLVAKEMLVSREEPSKAVEDTWRAGKVENYVTVTVAGQKRLVRIW